MELADRPERIAALSAGSLRRMESLALWPKKIAGLLSLYGEIVGTQKEGVKDGGSVSNRGRDENGKVDANYHPVRG
jgi:hypothetical protein